jgi:CubicO group peptidase (beta-lactamase class C family)
MAAPSVARSDSIVAFVPALERLITEAMDEWKVPGLAVAVVQNEQVPFVKAYGLRDVEAGLKVTTDTQFQLMSVSKPFTATGLALLVDERRMDWKKPVREYIPEFRLHDAIASDRVTVRDLLCHHSGLPRHDWIWLPGDLLPAQMMATMRYLSRATTFAAPSNTRTSATLLQVWWPSASAVRAGRIHPRADGQAAHGGDVHCGGACRPPTLPCPTRWKGTTRVRSKLGPVSVTAAGGMSTSIASFANWLRFHLGKGEFEGQRLLSPGLIQELQSCACMSGQPNSPSTAMCIMASASVRTGIAESARMGTAAALPVRTR